MNQLALGTVQFGLKYGITNNKGEISDPSMASMLKLAGEKGIELFDTAADYGSSQERLGSMSIGYSPRKYVTKFSLPKSGHAPNAMDIFQKSMNQLRVKQLHAVLFHKLNDLWDERLSATLDILRKGRDQGEINRIGVSIYNLDELSTALDVFPDLDIVQLPANLLDFELLESPILQDARNRGTEIHVRSIFLQGLLLSDPELLPDYFIPLKPALDELHKHAKRLGISVIQLILGKMKFHPLIDVVIVGATSVDELNEVTSAWNSAVNEHDLKLPRVEKTLLDPRTWPEVRLVQ